MSSWPSGSTGRTGGPPRQAGARRPWCWSVHRHRWNQWCPRRPSRRASPWCWPNPRCRGVTSPGWPTDWCSRAGRPIPARARPTCSLADSLAAAGRDSSVVIEDQFSRVLAYLGSNEVVDPVRSLTILGDHRPSGRELFDDEGCPAASPPPTSPCSEPSTAHGFRGRILIAVRRAGSSWLAVGRDRRPVRLRARPNPRAGAPPPAPAALAAAPTSNVRSSPTWSRVERGYRRRPGADRQLGLRSDGPCGSSRCRRTSRTSGTPPSCWRSRASRRASAGPGRAAVPCSQHRLHPCSPPGKRPRGTPATGGRRCAVAAPRLELGAGIGGPADAPVLPTSRP